MVAVLITGGSCSGKSTVAAALARRGLAALDADEVPWLAGWTDAGGRPAHRPAAPDLGWLRGHEWVWDLDRLDRVLAAAGGRTLFLCGNAANVASAWDRFARVVLLAVDEATMLRRLDGPTRDHDFGRVGDEREWLREWVPRHQADLLANGAARVDATRPLDDVVHSVLALAPDA